MVRMGAARAGRAARGHPVHPRPADRAHVPGRDVDARTCDAEVDERNATWIVLMRHRRDHVHKLTPSKYLGTE